MSAPVPQGPLTVAIARTPDPLNNCAKLYSDAAAFVQSLPNVRLIETDRTLASAADAVAIAAELSERAADLTILMCCRLAGDGRIVEPFMRSKQELMVWSVPEPQRTGNLTLNSLTCANLYLSTAQQLSASCGGKRAKWLYGEPQGPYFARRLTVTVGALRAKKRLSGAALLSVGDTADGFVNLQYSPEALLARFGARMLRVPLDRLAERMRAVPQSEAEALAERMRDWACGSTRFRAEVEQNARLALALEALQNEAGASALALRCWPEIQADWKFSACLALSFLNEQGTIVSCEGDMPGALTMLLLSEITGERPLLLDMVAADLDRDALQFWHCGIGMRRYMDGAGCELIKYPCDAAILDHPGACVDMKFAPCTVTICRLAGGDAGRLFVCQAEIVPGPDRGYDGGRAWIGNFTMEGRPISAAAFLDAAFRFGSPHHYAICAGEAESALREFAAHFSLAASEWQEYRDELR